MLLELALQPLEQGEGVGGRAGEAADHLPSPSRRTLRALGLITVWPSETWPSPGDHRLPVLAHRQDRRPVPAFHRVPGARPRGNRARRGRHRRRGAARARASGHFLLPDARAGRRRRERGAAPAGARRRARHLRHRSRHAKRRSAALVRSGRGFGLGVRRSGGGARLPAGAGARCELRHVLLGRSLGAQPDDQPQPPHRRACAWRRPRRSAPCRSRAACRTPRSGSCAPCGSAWAGRSSTPPATPAPWRSSPSAPGHDAINVEAANAGMLAASNRCTKARSRSACSSA
jgi:hypothetical protein